MAYGLEVYDADGNAMLSSPTGDVYYYDGNTAVEASQVTLGSAGLSNVGATLSATSQYYSAAYATTPLGFFNKNANTQWTYCYLRTTGVISNGVYYPPSKHSTSTGSTSLNTTIIRNGMHIYSTPATSYVFGQRTANGSTGYGFLTANDNNYLVIDTEHRPMFIQPASDGSIVRTVSVESECLKDDYYTPYYISGGSATLTLSQKPATITFDKAYTNPPLIFLSNSNDVYVSIYGFIKDANGKYVGVTLTTGAEMTGLYTYVLGNAPYSGTSTSTWRSGDSVNADIDVIVVSDELPTYLINGNSGLQTFDGSGSLLFDSRYSAIGFGVENVTMPYMYTRGVFSQDLLYNYHTYTHYTTDSQSFNMTGLKNAVCLNSFTPWAGMTAAIYRATNSSNYSVNFYGRYVRVDKSTDTTVTVAAKGSGMLGESAESTSDLKPYIWPYGSFDAHLGSTSTMDVITLSW